MVDTDTAEPLDDLQVAPDVSFRFETKRFALNGLLEKAGTVLPTRDIVPVLKNFQVQVTDEPPQIRVVATDLELSVLATSEMVTVTTPGVGVFPGQRFLELVREAKDGDLIVDVKDGIAEISVGRTSWTIRLLDGSDYPELADLSKVKLYDVDRSKFAQAIASVRHAASREAMRPQLMLIDISDQRMRAADGVRFQQVQAAWWPKALSFQLPVVAVDTLLKLLRATDLPEIKIGQTEDHIVFRIASDSYIAQKLNQEFPDMDEMLLKPALANDAVLTVDRDELEAAVKRVRVTADPDTSAVVLSLSKGQMTVKSKDRYGNAATEDIDAGWANGDRDIAFNHKMLLEMLQMADVKTCEFKVGKDTKTRRSPLLLQDEGSGLTSVLNQLRIDFLT